MIIVNCDSFLYATLFKTEKLDKISMLTDVYFNYL